jgi:hypothetical protein
VTLRLGWKPNGFRPHGFSLPREDCIPLAKDASYAEDCSSVGGAITSDYWVNRTAPRYFCTRFTRVRDDVDGGSSFRRPQLDEPPATRFNTVVFLPGALRSRTRTRFSCARYYVAILAQVPKSGNTRARKAQAGNASPLPLKWRGLRRAEALLGHCFTLLRACSARPGCNHPRCSNSSMSRT